MRRCRYCATKIPPTKKAICGAVACRRALKTAKMRTYLRNHPEKCKRVNDVSICTKDCRGCCRRLDNIRAFYCSDACRMAVARQKASTRWKARMVTVRAQRSMLQCKWCSVTFRPSHGGSVFCSLRCSRKRDKAKRVVVGSHEWKRKQARIMARDKGMCQLCRKRVVLTKGDPLSPSLDHIIPVAQGGSNDDANLQLAHLVCNVIKGNTIKGQLRLC
jgi:hypothetical protein